VASVSEAVLSDAHSDGHRFTDLVSGRTCAVVIGPATDLFDGETGVAHPGCDQLADISINLDAFYCRVCRYSGRVSGAWVVDLLRAHRTETSEAVES
jgi:hypothetical protein